MAPWDPSHQPWPYPPVLTTVLVAATGHSSLWMAAAGRKCSVLKAYKTTCDLDQTVPADFLFTLLHCTLPLSNSDYAAQRYFISSSFAPFYIYEPAPIALLTATLLSVLVKSIHASSLTRLTKRAPTCDEGVGTACTVVDANNCYAGIVSTPLFSIQL